MIGCYRWKRRLQTVTYTPNLVRGDPEGGPRRLRCLSAWGGAPCPLGPRTARPPLKVYASGHSALLVQPTPDTPSASAGDRPWHPFIMQADDELTFTVDGIVCKCVSNFRVRVGMNLPSRQRMLITRRVGEDAEATVKRYRDDQTTAPRFAAAINALRASGANPAKCCSQISSRAPNYASSCPAACSFLPG